TEERVNHAGKHYRVHGAQVLPRPTQHPHPPLVVGGHSELVLRVAARRAQIVSIGSPTKPRDGDIGPDALAARIAIVREAAAERFGAIAIHLLNDIRVTDAGREAYEATAAQLRLPIATLEKSPYFIYGGLATVAERV